MVKYSLRRKRMERKGKYHDELLDRIHSNPKELPIRELTDLDEGKIQRVKECRIGRYTPDLLLVYQLDHVYEFFIIDVKSDLGISMRADRKMRDISHYFSTHPRKIISKYGINIAEPCELWVDPLFVTENLGRIETYPPIGYKRLKVNLS